MRGLPVMRTAPTECAPVRGNRSGTALDELRRDAALPCAKVVRRDNRLRAEAFLDRTSGGDTSKKLFEGGRFRRIERADGSQDAALPFHLTAKKLARNIDADRRADRQGEADAAGDR